MTKRMDGKVAMVTGAGSGLGRAIAARLAGEGARVVAVDLAANSALATAELIRDQGGDAVACTADVSVAAGHESMADTATSAYGRLDVLVSNAGVGSVGTAVDLDEDEWDRVIDTNLKSVWLGARRAVPLMQEQGGGSIVNLASITAIRGYRAIAAYSAAKGGIVALTRQLAADWAADGIRVNAVAPGTVHTPLTQGLWEHGGGFGGGAASLDEQLAAAGRGYPLGRLGTPEDIANMVLFLATEEAGWITGGVFVVDGGRTSL